ncbi:MAG: S8 family serine peptidase [Bacteroidetes bacterium]|nr:S8 family serine peptidase [Bacteroidota bacterium]MBP9795564.1 S8 family serine peptidase [Chitinophagales bacterium]
MPISFSKKESNYKQIIEYKTTTGSGIVPLLKPIPIGGTLISPGLVEIGASIAASYKKTVFDGLNFGKLKESGKGTVLAVLDTGVFDGHPDLKGKVIYKTNYKGETKANNPNCDVEDKHGHGTHVAGLAAANKSKIFANFRGVAPDAEIVSVKVTDGDDSTTTWVNIKRGIEVVLQYNANPNIKPYQKVSCILLCFNGYDQFTKSTGIENHKIIQLFKECYTLNIPVIVSAGNHYLDFCRLETPGRSSLLRWLRPFSNYATIIEASGLAYPANNKYVISVGAISRDEGAYPLNINNLPPEIAFKKNDLAIFSQRMRTLKSRNRNINHDPFLLFASGVNMISCDNAAPGSRLLERNNYSTGYAEVSGSSQAAGIVAGTVLLCIEALKQNTAIPQPALTVKNIMSAIKNGAEDADFNAQGSRVTNYSATSNDYSFFALDIPNTLTTIAHL